MIKNPADNLHPRPFPNVKDIEGETEQFQPISVGEVVYPLPVDVKEIVWRVPATTAKVPAAFPALKVRLPLNVFLPEIESKQPDPLLMTTTSWIEPEILKDWIGLDICIDHPRGFKELTSEALLSNVSNDVVEAKKEQIFPIFEVVGPGQLEALVPASVAEIVMFDVAWHCAEFCRVKVKITGASVIFHFLTAVNRIVPFAAIH